jgi:hypothetical protein
MFEFIALNEGSNTRLLLNTQSFSRQQIIMYIISLLCYISIQFRILVLLSKCYTHPPTGSSHARVTTSRYDVDVFASQSELIATLLAQVDDLKAKNYELKQQAPRTSLEARFALEQYEKWKPHLDYEGWVVIKHAASQNEVEIARSLLWDTLEQTNAGRLDRKDPSTWDNLAPRQGGLSTGFVTGSAVPQACSCS